MNHHVLRARLKGIGLLTVANQIAKRHHVALDAVLGRTRPLHVARARHEIWAHVRAVTGMSYPELGAMFDVDHTTIMAGVRKATLRSTQAHAVRGLLRVV